MIAFHLLGVLVLSHLLPLLEASALCDPYGASFAYNESLQFTRRRRGLQLNTCPNHLNLCQYANCGGDRNTLASVHNQSIDIPLFPHLATQTTYITSSTTIVGIALNGVYIYGQPINQSYEVPPPVDACGGNSEADGVYHYSLLPTCLLRQLNFSLGKHSPQVGWALDGFPIYGPIGFKGVTMLRCDVSGAHPVVCLDECNGFYGELRNVDSYLYRYYLPGEVGNGHCSPYTINQGPCPRDDHPCCLNILPSAAFHPLSISCFKGCPLSNFSCVNSNSRGVTPAFYPMVSAFPTTTYQVNLTELPMITNNSTSTTPPTSSPSNTSTQIQVEPPLTFALVRMPFNNSLAIVSNNAPISSPLAIQMEVLPSSSKDAYIAGLAVSLLESRLYFSTQFGVFFTALYGGGLSCAISGYVPIVILGYNLNTSSNTIPEITVGSKTPKPCSNIVIVSDFEVHCTLLLNYNRYGNQRLTDYSAILAGSLDTLTLTTLRGTVSSTIQVFNNISTDPTPFSIDDVISHSNRPVISNAIAGNISGSSGYEAPFRPYAIAVSSGSTSGVYFSEFTQNCIFASYFGRNANPDLYIIKSHVSKVYSLSLIPISQLLEPSVLVLEAMYGSTDSFTGDLVVYVDGVRGVVGYTLPHPAGSCPAFNCDRDENILLTGLDRVRSVTAEGPASSGSNLLFVLFQDGRVLRINVDGYFAEISLNLTQSYTFSPALTKSWLRVFTAFGATTRSRFSDIFIAPSQGYIAPSSPFTSASNDEEILQRMLISNSNEEQIITPLRSNSCMDGMGTYQPWAALCTSSRGNILIDNVHDGVVYPTGLTGFSTGSDGSYNYSKIFLAEYLGKIWSLTVRRKAVKSIDPFNPVNINLDRTDALSLFVDLSDFSSSQLIRSKRVSYSPPSSAVVVDTNGIRGERIVTSETSIFYEVID